MDKQLPINEIINADTLEYLPTIPENCVDLVFADPPYNLQLKQDLWRPNQTQVDAVDDAWDQFDSFADYDDFTHKWLTEVRRVMKTDSSIWVSGTYHNIFRVGTIMQDLGFWVLNTVTWFKTNAMPNFRGTRLKNDVEFIIWAKRSEKSRYTFHHHQMKQFNNGKQLGSVWTIPACGGAERLKGTDGKKLHSTQKPEKLLKRIIMASSNPKDIVLDPFSGTGTTATIAKRLRRKYIGIERNSMYAQASRDRIAQISPMSNNATVIKQALSDKPKRIAFKTLLKHALLEVGQGLVLDEPETNATILANGKLQSNGYIGSIHQLGAKLKGTPSCNGWVHWHYEDEQTGKRYPIDNLRKQFRAEFTD